MERHIVVLCHHEALFFLADGPTTLSPSCAVVFESVDAAQTAARGRASLDRTPIVQDRCGGFAVRPQSES